MSLRFDGRRQASERFLESSRKHSETLMCCPTQSLLPHGFILLTWHLQVLVLKSTMKTAIQDLRWNAEGVVKFSSSPSTYRYQLHVENDVLILEMEECISI